MASDTSPVRQGEQPDASALAAYLQMGDIEIAQFPNGHSNLVYLVRAGGQEYVLRRPPLGPVAPKAHDMAREYRVLHAVHPYFPEAPRVVLLCEDVSVIGSAFFLMERRHGVVVRETVPPEWEGFPACPFPAYTRLASEAFVDCLVRLHNVDINAPELRGLGKPEGFVARQVLGWTERWQRAKTEEMPQMDRVAEWLRERIPPSPQPTLVHNDFKLDNIMLAPEADRVTAVLDWEMATLGDPLADLGLTLCYWAATPCLTTGPGWFTRDEFVEHYARRTGRDMTHLPYHEVLGIFKLAVILQQIYFRFRQGQTTDQRFRHFDQRVRGLVSLASQMVRQHA